jgi:apoptosis-inducing factor 3
VPYAAGGIARWPDPHTGENIRIEYWVVAERQGQTLAQIFSDGANDFPLSRSSRAAITTRRSIASVEKRDELEIEGDINARDCLVRYRRGNEVLAIASIFCDLENLKEKEAMEGRAVHPARYRVT